MSEDASAGRLYVDVAADVSGLRRDLQAKLDAVTRDLRIKLQADLDTTRLRVQARAAMRDLSAEAKIQASLEISKTQARAALAEATRGLKVKLTAEADTKQARADLDAAAKPRTAKITAQADTGAARAGLDAAARPRTAKIRTEADKNSLTKTAETIGGKIASVSLSAGKWVAALPLAAGAAGNLAGALTGVVGAASQAVGVVGALPGLLAGAAQGGGTLLLSFQGIGSALQALDKLQLTAGKSAKAMATQHKQAAQELKNLGPAAAGFALFIHDRVEPEFKALQHGVQEAFLPPLQQAVQAGLPLLATIRTGLTGTARDLGGFARQLGTLVGSNQFRSDFASVMANNNLAFRNFGDAAIHVVRAIENVTVAAEPLVQRISEVADRVATAADEATRMGRATGSLTAYFDQAWRSAETLGTILGNVGVSVMHVLHAASPAGGTILDKLAAATDRLREWTGSPDGQAKLEKFFTDSVPTAERFGKLLVEVADVVVKLAAATGGSSLSALFTLLDDIAGVLLTIEKVPGLGQVLQWTLAMAVAGVGIGRLAGNLGGVVKSVTALTRLPGLKQILAKLGVTDLLTRAAGGAGGKGGVLGATKAAVVDIVADVVNVGAKVSTGGAGGAPVVAAGKGVTAAEAAGRYALPAAAGTTAVVAAAAVAAIHYLGGQAGAAVAPGGARGFRAQEAQDTAQHPNVPAPGTAWAQNLARYTIQPAQIAITDAYKKANAWVATQWPFSLIPGVGRGAPGAPAAAKPAAPRPPPPVPSHFALGPGVGDVMPARLTGTEKKNLEWLAQLYGVTLPQAYKLSERASADITTSWQKNNAAALSAKTRISAVAAAEDLFRGKVKSGTKDLDAYTASLRLNGSASATTITARRKLIQDLKDAGLSSSQTRYLLSQLTKGIGDDARTLTTTRPTRKQFIDDLTASGLHGGIAKRDVDSFTSAVQKFGAGSQQGQGARRQLLHDLQNAGVGAQAARKLVADYTATIANDGLITDRQRAARLRFLKDLTDAGVGANRALSDVHNYTTAVRDNGARSDAARAARTKLIRDLENAGASAQAAHTLVDGYTRALSRIPGHVTTRITATGKGSWAIVETSGAFAGTRVAGTGGSAPSGSTVRRGAGGGHMRGPGGPTGDQIPAMLSDNEYVIQAAAVDRYGTDFFDMLNSMAFKAGGHVKRALRMAAGGLAGLTGRPAVVEQQTGQQITHAIEEAIKKAVTQAEAPVGGAGGAARWANVILAALSMLGQPASWLSTVERRMNQESGGNPAAVNRWDSNAKAGIPSQGLMQVVPPTFLAYAGSLAGRGILDPLANVYAGLNYALHRYGSLAALDRPGGYALGGAVHRFAAGGSTAAQRAAAAAQRAAAAAQRRAASARAAAQRRAASALSAEQRTGEPIADRYLSGLVRTLSAIRSEQNAAIKAIQRYYSGHAAEWREKMIDRQTAQLNKVATAASNVAKQITAAKTYETQTRQSLAGYGDLSALTTSGLVLGPGGPTTVGGAIAQQLHQKLATLRRFQNLLKQLLKAGVSKVLIRQVVALGPDQGVVYAQALLSGGRALIRDINATEAAIGATATSVARTATNVLYDSGKQAGKGFLSGLRAQQAALDREMRRLGDVMGREIAKWFRVPRSKLPHYAAGGRVSLNGGTRAVAALRMSSSLYRSTAGLRLAGGGQVTRPGLGVTQAVVNVYPAPGMSEEEIGAVAARRLGAMLA